MKQIKKVEVGSLSHKKFSKWVDVDGIRYFYLIRETPAGNYCVKFLNDVLPELLNKIVRVVAKKEGIADGR